MGNMSLQIGDTVVVRYKRFKFSGFVSSDAYDIDVYRHRLVFDVGSTPMNKIHIVGEEMVHLNRVRHIRTLLTERIKQN